jgi:hypothetical protein
VVFETRRKGTTFSTQMSGNYFQTQQTQ